MNELSKFFLYVYKILLEIRKEICEQFAVHVQLENYFKYTTLLLNALMIGTIFYKNIVK